MNRDSQQLLTSVPFNDWRIKQVIVFEWYDGPIEGLCQMTYPSVEFYFQCFAEQVSTEDLNDRLYHLSELEIGSIQQVIHALSGLGTPKEPIWIPIWRFDSMEEQEKVEAAIRQFVVNRKPSNLIIQSKDFSSFDALWQSIVKPQAG